MKATQLIIALVGALASACATHKGVVAPACAPNTIMSEDCEDGAGGMKRCPPHPVISYQCWGPNNLTQQDLTTTVSITDAGITTNFEGPPLHDFGAPQWISGPPAPDAAPQPATPSKMTRVMDHVASFCDAHPLLIAGGLFATYFGINALMGSDHPTPISYSDPAPNTGGGAGSISDQQAQCKAQGGTWNAVFGCVKPVAHRAQARAFQIGFALPIGGR